MKSFRSAARTRGLAALALVGSLALAGCGSLTESTQEAGADGGTDPGVDQVKVIVPADPGGGWDATGRAMAKVMGDNGLVDSSQVVNVGGAGGTVGLAQLANEQEPNTLMVMGLVMVGAIETNQSQVTLDDVTPVARLTEEAEVVVVPKDSPYDTITDLVDDIKAHGKDVTVTGGSAGGVDHILAALLLQESGVPADDIASDLNYIPYSGGGESLAALLGGKVDAGISGVSEYAEQVKAGELKALAVSSEEPSALLPDVPTIAESGIDLTVTNWRGVVAPGSVGDDKAAELTQLVTDMHATDDWSAVLETNAWQDAMLTGDELETFLDDDVTRVQGVLRDIGLVG